jgi:hypothetical protein
MDHEDWKRIEELVHQAGGVAHSDSASIPDMVRADAMSFHTLGLALLDIYDRLARLEAPTHKPILLTPYG